MQVMKFGTLIATYIFICTMNLSQPLKFIPQKANLTYFNEKYMKWANLTVRRYGRKSDYYLNVEGGKYHTWDNNVTLHLIFNEYLHNEYRRSFVEMKFKICDMLEKDIYLGAMFAGAGLTCPIVIKEVHLMNLTAPTQNFPYAAPFEKARVDLSLLITKTGELIAAGQIYALFKEQKVYNGAH